MRNIDDQRVLAVSVKVACGNVQIGVGFIVSSTNKAAFVKHPVHFADPLFAFIFSRSCIIYMKIDLLIRLIKTYIGNMVSPA